MNRITKLFSMLQQITLLACIALLNTSAFAAAVNDLTPDRHVIFDDHAAATNGVAIWARIGNAQNGSRPGTNHFYRANAQTNANLQAYVQWTFRNFRVGRMLTSASLSVPPANNGNTYPVAAGVNWSGYFLNTDQAVIQSPIFTNGIGKIYFDLLLGEESTIPPIIKISIATNILDAGSIVYPIPPEVWEQIDSIELTTTQLVQHVVQVNYASPIAIKLERSTVNGSDWEDAYVAIDNIRVSKPPADVLIDKDVTPFNVYPSVNQNMNVQFRIDNAPGPNSTKAATRTNVVLVSRWNYLNQVTTPWVTNVMQCVNTGDGAGNGELWRPQDTLRVYPDAGDLEYVLLCYFNGEFYQSYDYTVFPKVLNPVLFPPENKSPRLYSADGITDGSGSITNNPFIFPLRLFPSQHETVSTVLYVNGVTNPIVLPMTLVGTNKWQAKYDVVNYPDSTNLLWYFQATGAFTNNFRTFPGKVYWQNTNRSRIQNGVLPYGDNCGMTDGSLTNRPEDWFGVTVTPNESSYVLFTLDTAKTNYLAGRGEYQNFNAWNTGTAAQNAFTDADDKYPKVSYSENFSSGWQASYFTGLSNWFGTITFAGYTAPVRVGPEPIRGQETFWSAGSFQYVTERTAINGLVADADTTGQRRNQGIRLLGGSDGLGLGYYQGNLGQQNGINGVGTVNYKARLSRPLATDPDYNYNVAYRWTDMMRTNYMVSCIYRAVSASPETPSTSLIAYYQSPRKFYEYRIVQLADARDIVAPQGVNTGYDKYVAHQIWKWNGSATPVLLAESKRVNAANTGAEASWDAKITDNVTDKYTEFRLYTTLIPTPSVTIRVKFRGSEIPFPAGGTTFEVVDSTNPILFGGYGFHSADCTLQVSEMVLNNTGTGATAGGSGLQTVIGGDSSNHDNEWYWPSELYSRSGVTFAPANSPAQSTTVNVLTGTTPTGPWTPFKTQTVSSYAYTDCTATTNAWNNLCARIQANDMVGVVVDGVRVGSWRGETIVASPTDNWKITEGWLNNIAPDGWYAHLDASQADPELIQGVRSQRILGLGSIAFDYRVVTPPAQVKIQYTANAFPQDDSESGWVDVTNLNFTAATAGFVGANYYLAIAPATNLYVRVINNVVTNRKATVDLRNIVIWNNPTNSPNDWAAYNMKISDTETDKWWLDKKTVTGGLDVARSGYMNNSQTANIIAGRPMTQFNPYIMAPRLTGGLGTISFLARAFTTAYAAGNTNTTIAVYVTTDGWDKSKPDVFWDKVHTFRNITNGFYRPFVYSHPTVPNEIKAVKLVVENVVPLVGTPQRVCIEEIVVTEAIYPRFDITGVKLLLPGTPNPSVTKQPLEGEDIGIEAQLTNVLLDPENIQVKVTYVLGTNTWGVFNAPLNKQVTKTLTLVDAAEHIYRTTGDFMNNGIPEQDKYNVIQYIVWADYVGNGLHTIYQTPATAEHFSNPAWYFPVDLNREGHTVTGAPKASWTPYYITYDVPPGSVWINELNLNENSLAIGPKVFLNPYIEIAQPAWMDLTGWRMEILNIYYEPRLAWRIESQGAIQPALGANGYGLFVVGPYAFEATTATPPYPPLSTTTTVHQAIQNIRGDSGSSLYPGGYRLVRPMGMYEHAIAYEWDPNTINWVTGETFVQGEPAPQTPFKYVGREYYNGSLSFTGTVNVAAGQYARTDTTDTWEPGMLTFNWTPGQMNVGQVFPAAPSPGGSNVLVTSTLLSPDGLTHGWQNNVRQNPLQFKLKKGQGTNFVYAAEPWFRFYGVTSNSVELLSPVQQTTITNFALALVNIQTNVNLLADLRLAPNVIDLVTTPGMIEWLQQYPDRALAPSYLNATGTNLPLSLLEKYWLDMDPTQTNRLLFTNRAIEPDTYGLWLTLEMATINQAGQTNRLTRLLGDAMVSIWIKESFTTQPYRPFGQYYLTDRSFDSNYWARTRINAYTNASAWFKWRLDANDQRLSTNELINIPAP